MSQLVKWEQLTKRLEGIAERECANKGFAIMTLHILVDASGQPAFWTEPELQRLETRVGAGVFMDRVLKLFAKGSL